MYVGGTSTTTDDYTIAAASGVDWRGVVPSPAAASLLGMGSLLVSRRCR